MICLVVAGAPVLILEVCLGQFASQGGITAWLICPLFQGLFEVVYICNGSSLSLVVQLLFSFVFGYEFETMEIEI